MAGLPPAEAIKKFSSLVGTKFSHHLNNASQFSRFPVEVRMQIINSYLNPCQGRAESVPHCGIISLSL